MVKCFIFSFLVSIIKIFQYQLNVYDKNKEYPMVITEDYDYKIPVYSNGSYVVDWRPRSSLIFYKIFEIIYELLNSFILIIINLAIDILLIIVYGKILEKKKSMSLNKKSIQTCEENNNKILKMVIQKK